MKNGKELNTKKMKYKIYYAESNLQAYIPCLEFKNWKERMLFVCDKVTGSQGKVFILSINYSASSDFDSVYIFHVWNCVRFLTDRKYNSIHYTFYLQEYSSYEEAYRVALYMKEVSPLCYSSINMES